MPNKQKQQQNTTNQPNKKPQPPQKNKDNSKTFQEKVTFVSKWSSFTPVVEILYLSHSFKFTSQQSISRMKQKAPRK